MGMSNPCYTLNNMLHVFQTALAKITAVTLALFGFLLPAASSSQHSVSRAPRIGTPHIQLTGTATPLFLENTFAQILPLKIKIPSAPNVPKTTDTQSLNQKPVAAPLISPEPTSPAKNTPEPETQFSSETNDHRFDAAGKIARAATMSIICTVTRGTKFAQIVGTGVIVSKEGAVLTNAHVAQFFLLQNADPNTKCTLESVNFPGESFTADIVYVTPSWIQEHARDILNANALGNGEKDFALLLIRRSGSSAKTFPFIPLETSGSLQVGTEALLAGYPAGLQTLFPLRRLLFVAATAPVTAVFGYDSPQTDVASLGGTLVAGHGASGGPALNEQGNLIGLIYSTTDGGTVADRSARIISLSYIARAFAAEKGSSLENFLASDLQQQKEMFGAGEAQSLSQLLFAAVPSTW